METPAACLLTCKCAVVWSALWCEHACTSPHIRQIKKCLKKIKKETVNSDLKEKKKQQTLYFPLCTDPWIDITTKLQRFAHRKITDKLESTSNMEQHSLGICWGSKSPWPEWRVNDQLKCWPVFLCSLFPCPPCCSNNLPHVPTIEMQPAEPICTVLG